MQAVPSNTLLKKPQLSSTTQVGPWASGPQPTVLTKCSSIHSAGRIKLWNLPQYLLCSIIGTCLTAEELRKLVIRCSGVSFKQSADLAIHEEGVQLAAQAEPGGRMLHKALDQRYEPTIKRFDKAKTVAEVAELWEEAKERGEIPGVYWALLTHRSATADLRQTVFGDVHMLSHLVGAANRADIRRLASLTAQNAELTSKIEKQEMRLRDMLVSRDETIKRLSKQLSARIFEVESPKPSNAIADADEIRTLRELVVSLQHRLGTDALRHERALQRAENAAGALARAEAALCRARESEQSMQAELDGAERQLVAMGKPEDESADALHTMVEGRTIVYIGGRPGTLSTMRSLVERGNGEFVHHDGGLEDRKGLLASVISKADWVLFPVDCVSHDAVLNLKRLCQQAGKPYRALRTASIASFITALLAGSQQSVAPPVAVLTQHARTLAPHFCLRHG